VRLPKLTLPSIRRLPIPPIPRRAKIVLGVVAAVITVIVGTWTVRHAWSIYRLNRGVGVGELGVVDARSVGRCCGAHQ